MKTGKPRIRRTNSTLFVDALKEISGGEQKLVSNTAVRNKLGWDEERYARIKSQLVSENKLVVGRGYGGSVGLATAEGAKVKALSVFISYSHADEALKDKLVKHLMPLKRMELIEEWYDRKITAGEIGNPRYQRICRNLRLSCC